MVAARIPLCSESAMTRSTNFSLWVAESPFATLLLAGADLDEAALDAGAGFVSVAAETLGRATEFEDAAGESAVAREEPDVAAGAPGAELPLVFAARPAACLHRSDSESLCSLRQATIRPPPGCTPGHSFCASSAPAQIAPMCQRRRRAATSKSSYQPSPKVGSEVPIKNRFQRMPNLAKRGFPLAFAVGSVYAQLPAGAGLLGTLLSERLRGSPMAISRLLPGLFEC